MIYTVSNFRNVNDNVSLFGRFFLGARRYVPPMIRRVGHVRVFAALGSFISALLIIFLHF